MQPYLPYSSEREGGFVIRYVSFDCFECAITTDNLDIIIPSYEAVLVLSRPDKRPSAYFVKCFLDLYDLSTLVRQNQAKRCFTSWSLRTSNWSVEVYKNKVSAFHTGPGIYGSDENSIVKWGKMGASVHRTSKKLAIGGKPPYLTCFSLQPFFGMFGYGGTSASMHLWRLQVDFEIRQT
ncbi:uncharacterized protein LOC125494939 [Beta vulgaris subsp. vulgaris]|uniref:uncharacterized protein LOC125494939 n=1 Tax=Beta vulgaris subsp. vulgaris TaxID=3555 RepID=UPI0025492E88|nr:uncharacterized protein LOC125494939 [Beta vulgaris subsp. vulgaris]